MSESRFPEEAEESASLKQPVSAEQGAADQKTVDGPVGIGGWLSLPIMSEGIALLLVLRTLLFTGSVREVIITPGDEAPHEMLAFTIMFEIFATVASAVLSIGVLVLVWLRSKYAPRAFIGLYLFEAATTLLMLYTSGLVPRAAESLVGIAGIVFASLFMHVIWIVYFLKSRRVKNTFVR